MAKVNPSRPNRKGTSTADPIPETSGIERPSDMPVRQRRRGPTRAPAAGAPPSTGAPAVSAADGVPAGTEADRSGDSDGGAHRPDGSGEAAGYSVGYKRPPKHSQYKKGQTGNPAGRTRGSRNLRTIYRQERDTRVEITENGRRRKVSKIEVIMKKTFNEALNGNTKARDAVLKLETLYGTDQPLPEAGGRMLDGAGSQDEQDNELIADFKQWILEQEKAAEPDSSAGEAQAGADAAAEPDTEMPPSPADRDSAGDDAEEGSRAAGAAETTPTQDPEHSSDRQQPAVESGDGDDEVVTFDRPLRAFRDGEWT